MAHGNELGSFFGCHDAGHARDGEHVALLDFVLQDERECFGTHVNRAAGRGDPAGNFFFAHVDHARPALIIQMTELCHKTPAFGPDMRFTASSSLKVHQKSSGRERFLAAARNDKRSKVNCHLERSERS
jgi:hypothetical protein